MPAARSPPGSPCGPRILIRLTIKDAKPVHGRRSPVAELARLEGRRTPAGIRLTEPWHTAVSVVAGKGAGREGSMGGRLQHLGEFADAVSLAQRRRLLCRNRARSHRWSVVLVPANESGSSRPSGLRFWWMDVYIDVTRIECDEKEDDTVAVRLREALGGPLIAC